MPRREARRCAHAQRAQAARVREAAAGRRARAAARRARAPEETGSTYADNALIKARAAAAATGRVAIADDSGIEAAALGGAPGVRSARYAGEHATDGENLAKLRAEVPEGTALRYVCVIARVAPDGAEQLFEGTCDGVMAPAGRGSRGFGYDPVFVPDDRPPADARWPS